MRFSKCLVLLVAIGFALLPDSAAVAQTPDWSKPDSFGSKTPSNPAAIVTLPGNTAADGGAVITARDAYTAEVRHQTSLIDVREPYEVRRGAPTGTFARIPYRLDGTGDDQFVAAVIKAVDGNRASDITLICATGVRSAAARDVLIRLVLPMRNRLAEGLRHGGKTVFRACPKIPTAIHERGAPSPGQSGRG